MTVHPVGTEIEFVWEVSEDEVAENLALVEVTMSGAAKYHRNKTNDSGPYTLLSCRQTCDPSAHESLAGIPLLGQGEGRTTFQFSYRDREAPAERSWLTASKRHEQCGT